MPSYSYSHQGSKQRALRVTLIDTPQTATLLTWMHHNHMLLWHHSTALMYHHNILLPLPHTLVEHSVPSIHRLPATASLIFLTISPLDTRELLFICPCTSVLWSLQQLVQNLSLQCLKAKPILLLEVLIFILPSAPLSLIPRQHFPPNFTHVTLKRNALILLNRI